MTKAPLRTVLLLAFTVMLAPMGGCESKVTAENFDKLKLGMSQYEVEQILGKGTDDTTSGGYGTSAAGVADSKTTNEKRFIWSDGEAKIIIVFKDDKVVEKNKQGL